MSLLSLLPRFSDLPLLSFLPLDPFLSLGPFLPLLPLGPLFPPLPFGPFLPLLPLGLLFFPFFGGCDEEGAGAEEGGGGGGVEAASNMRVICSARSSASMTAMGLGGRFSIFILLSFSVCCSLMYAARSILGLGREGMGWEGKEVDCGGGGRGRGARGGGGLAFSFRLFFAACSSAASARRSILGLGGRCEVVDGEGSSTSRAEAPQLKGFSGSLSFSFFSCEPRN